MNKDLKLSILIEVLIALYYIVWTAVLVTLYILVFAKGYKSVLMIFTLGFTQACWISAIIYKIKDNIERYSKKETTNINIRINKNE